MHPPFTEYSLDLQGETLGYKGIMEEIFLVKPINIVHFINSVCDIFKVV